MFAVGDHVSRCTRTHDIYVSLRTQVVVHIRRTCNTDRTHGHAYTNIVRHKRTATHCNTLQHTATQTGHTDMHTRTLLDTNALS